MKFDILKTIGLQKRSLIAFLLLLASYNTYANNISVTNVKLTGQNTTSDYVMVQFDISWENSWKVSTGPNNWDAAWVFVKYRVGSTGAWSHALINTTGNTAPSGSSITVPSDKMGAFIYRSTNGIGAFSKSGIQLRWNYGENSLGDNDVVDIKVYALEMVYVPEGSFFIGSGGTETSAFYKYPTTTNPYQIVNEGAITVGIATDNLYYASSTNGGDQSGPIPTAYPKGYNAFYCMKYEITQQAYVDFLNTLDRTQQDTRTETSLASGNTSVTNRYVMSNSSTLLYRNAIRCDATIHTSDPITFYCDLNGNDIGDEATDGQWIACNYLSWTDLAAYLDWAGLRPMTELEFEKACRGDKSAVANEYAWGNTSIAGSTYTLSNTGATNEDIATNYSTILGNASYNVTGGAIDGPLRVGVFAANSSNIARLTSGATYYGIMEMSGNLWEHLVSVGSIAARSYTGLQGKGNLNANGEATVDYWPGINGNSIPTVSNTTYGGITGVSQAAGTSLRSGAYSFSSINLRVSDRKYSSDNGASPDRTYGGRGVRTAP